MQHTEAGFDFAAFAGSMLDAVILADSAGVISYVNQVTADTFGYTSGELVGRSLEMLMPERYREHHRMGMARIQASGPARLIGQILNLHGLKKDKTEFPIELSLTKWMNGGEAVFSGIIRDVTAQRESDRRESTRHSLTRLIAESQTLMEAVTRVMETICTSMHWDIGAMWCNDPRTDTFRCVQFWDSQAPRRSQFEKETLSLQFQPGEGMPGQVWATSAPVWWTDLTERKDFVRSASARQLRLSTGFAFPIVDPTGLCVGVLEFFTENRRQPDTRLLEMMADLGRLIGTLLQRAHAEAAVLSIVEQMQIGIHVYHVEDLADDRSLRLISVNPFASVILGLPADDLVGNLIDENFPRLRDHGIPAIYLEVVRTQRSTHLEDVVYDTRPANRAIFELRAFPLPNHCIGVAFENITKRKGADQLIAAERRVLERIVEGATLNVLIEEVAAFSDAQTPGMLASILLLSADGTKLEYASAPHLAPEFTKMTDSLEVREPHVPSSLSISQRNTIVISSIAKDDRALTIRDAALQHGYRACWSTPIITLSREVVGTMTLFYEEERSPNIHELEVVEFAVRLSAIIIERRQSEEAVRRSEARFRGLIQNSSDAINLLDANGTVTFRTPAARRILGFEDEEVLGQLPFNLVHPDDAPAVQAAFAECVRTRTPVSATFRVQHKNGSWIFIEGTLSNLLHDESVQSLVFNFRDVNEKYLSAQVLRESEERFNSFMRHAPVAAFIKDAGSHYIWINEELAQRFGLRMESVIGKTDLEIFDRDTAEQNMLNDRQVLEGGRPIDSSSTMRTADGVERSWLMTEFPLDLSTDQRHVGGVAIDVTDRNALEQQLERSERISGLGRVAASIAHEINNVLMGILPFAESIKSMSVDHLAIQNAAGQIVRSVQRGRGITQEILAFTRATDPVVRPFDCRSWLKEITPELRSLAGSGIDLQILLPPAGIFVRGDALQLHQVLANLSLNARDAMHGAGTLIIRAAGCEPGDTLPFAGAPHPEGSLLLTVADTGSGISPAILDRIFEPLFTTKKNQGTGLGLAIAHGVIERHGGQLEVESIEGKGTKFLILLPCASGPREEAHLKQDRGVTLVQRVLLIEDDLAVGEGLVALLDADGVAAMWVQSGAEAAAAVASFRPDVVILDVGLPDTNGFDLYRRLAARFPNLPTIFSTGHGDQSLVDQFTGAPIAYLMKPYDYDTLVQTMNELVS